LILRPQKYNFFFYSDKNVIFFLIFAVLKHLKFIIMQLMILLLGGLGWGEIIAIALIILLLFGGRKIPELMRGLGKGVKSFKDGVNGFEEPVVKEDEKKE
jgi:sec-independent protein translocase protein TatA